MDQSSQPRGTPTDWKRLTDSQAGWQATEWLDIDDTVGRTYNEISSLTDFGEELLPKKMVVETFDGEKRGLTSRTRFRLISDSFPELT